MMRRDDVRPEKLVERFFLLSFCFLLLNTHQVEIVSNNCFSNKLRTEQRGERFHSEDLPVQSVICRHK